MTPTSHDAKNKAEPPEDCLGEPLDSLSVELGRISAEIQSINSGFQVQMQQVLADTRTAIEKQYRTQFERSIQEIREQLRLETKDEFEQKFQEEKKRQENQFQEELERRIGHMAGVTQEINRVATELESLNTVISALLDDPQAELSKIMHKRKEQAGLKAYFDGLCFSIGEKKIGS